MTGTARIASIAAGLLFLPSSHSFSLLSLLLPDLSTFLKTSTTFKTPQQMIFSTAIAATLAASLVTAQASAVPKQRRWGSACQELWKTAPELLPNLEVYAAQNYPGEPERSQSLSSCSEMYRGLSILTFLRFENSWHKLLRFRLGRVRQSFVSYRRPRPPGLLSIWCVHPHIEHVKSKSWINSRISRISFHR